MSNYDSQAVGAGGCDMQIGAGTYTPSGEHAGKKIHAIGVYADAQITSFAYTGPEGAITVSTLKWMGIVLTAEKATTAFIPLGRNANSIIVASGTIFVYFA
jgi:hypothetical protein